MTSSNVQPLWINERYYGSVKSAKDKYKIYETFVTNGDEKFVVEVDNCVGSTEIVVAKSFSDLMENKFEYKNSKSQYGKIFAPLQVPKEGTVKYVIGVRSNNIKANIDQDYSDYYIETRNFETDDEVG